jgi:hypothetical protein
MNRQIRIQATVRREPDIRLYVQALIALARQLQEEEQRAETNRLKLASGKTGGTAHG